jgi:hypothetical protein
MVQFIVNSFCNDTTFLLYLIGLYVTVNLNLYLLEVT